MKITLGSTTRHATRSSLIAVASTGALVAVAAWALPAAGTTPTTARATKTTALPTSTSPTTTSPTTTPATRSFYDFEDGTTQGWVSNSKKMTVAARPEGAQEGSYGLVVTNFGASAGKKSASGPSLTVADDAFAGSGDSRLVGIHLRALWRAKQTTTKPKTTYLCGRTPPTTPAGPTVAVMVESGGTVIGRETVTLDYRWNAVNLALPSGSAPVTIRLALVSGNVTKLMLDEVSLVRFTAETTAPTASMTTASDDSRPRVQPFCTSRGTSTRS